MTEYDEAIGYDSSTAYDGGTAPVPVVFSGGKNVRHPIPEWYSLAPYKYAIADEIRRREEEEIMVLID